jgi:hypothetical protein
MAGTCGARQPSRCAAVLAFGDVERTKGVLRGLLYDVEPTELVTFAVILVVALAVSLLTTLVPAGRAARFGSSKRMSGGWQGTVAISQNPLVEEVEPARRR